MLIHNIPEMQIEAKFILAILNSKIEILDNDSIMSNLDWEKVYDLTKKNKILPVFYRKIEPYVKRGQHPDIAKKFQQDYQDICEYNDKNIILLNELLDIFKNNNIEAVPFKGLVFSDYVYKSIYAREKGDLDLVVQPKEFLRALDILIRNDFEHIYFGHAQVSTVQAQLGRSDRLASVDLHYALTPQYQLTHMNEAQNGSYMQPDKWNSLVENRTYWFFQYDLEPVWKRLKQHTINDYTYDVMSDEDMFMVAFINGFKENWRAFIRFYDLCEIVNNIPGLDWDFILSQVTELRARKKMSLCLRVLHEYMNCPLPDHVVKFTLKNSNKILAEELVYRLLNQARHSNMEEFRRIVAVMTMDNHRDCIKYLLFIWRTPNDPFGRKVSKNGFFGFIIVLLKQIIICNYHQ